MILASDPNHLLLEAEQICRAIAASEVYMKTLAAKRDEIMDTLDTLTRPPLLPQAPVRRTVRRGFEYFGDHTRRPNYLSIYLSLLGRLWQDFPEKREQIAHEVGRMGYSRRYIAQDRMALFTRMSEAWTIKYSRKLCDGWYVDTNVNRKQIHTILHRAVTAAGLKWGTDVCVYWDTQTL